MRGRSRGSSSRTWRGWWWSVPSDTGIRQARAKTDRLDARTLARLLASGELDAVWMPDRAHLGDASSAVASGAVGVGAVAGQERDPRGVDALSGRPGAVRAICSGSRAGAGWPSSSCRSRSARPSTRGCARSSSSTPRSRGRAADRPRGAGLGADPAADDRARGQRDRGRQLYGRDRRHSPLRQPAQAGRLSRVWTRGCASPAVAPRATGGSQSRGRCAPATRWWSRAGARSASPVRCTPSTSACAPAAGTRSPSSPAHASWRACSGSCSRARRTTPTPSPR